MRQTCLDMVYELAKRDPRVFFIGSDLGCGTLQEFQRDMPERFFMEGISEANVVSMAAGLAMNGKIPYVNTIASFLTRRSFEQVALDLCLHNVPVRLLGNGGGMVYAPLGPTHMTVEDLATMRAIPNMTVLAPCDAEEMKRAMEQTLDYPGPIYIRFGKGFDPVVSSAEHPFVIGKGIVMREGEDALLISTGITLKVILDAADQLAEKGIAATVLHLPTVKPLDREIILDMAEKTRVVVTVEEHSILGGLGGAVAEVLAEANLGRPLCFRRLGIPDTFPEDYGSQNSLMERYGITGGKTVATVLSLLEKGE